jgi:uncharacterized protein YeaO (DUF488 family)
MSIRVVQLGTPRQAGEGLRIGTVRRPPRGVPKSKHASGNWYDVWLPNLAPSAELMKSTNILADKSGWKKFENRYRAELKRPDQAHLIATLAALSRTTDFSVGCYCEDERVCHRSILKDVLRASGATLR